MCFLKYYFSVEDEVLITSGLENEPKVDLEAMCKPPSAKRVALIREQKLKEKKMSEILKELTFFVFYIMLLFLVSASNRDINAYKQRMVIDRLIKNGGSKFTPMVSIDKVSTYTYTVTGIKQNTLSNR